MVALGRALLANPRLLLCDEISLALAPKVVNEPTRWFPTSTARHRHSHRRAGYRGVGLTVADRFIASWKAKLRARQPPKDVTRDVVMKHYFGL